MRRIIACDGWRVTDCVCRCASIIIYSHARSLAHTSQFLFIHFVHKASSSGSLDKNWINWIWFICVKAKRLCYLGFRVRWLMLDTHSLMFRCIFGSCQGFYCSKWIFHCAKIKVSACNRNVDQIIKWRSNSIIRSFFSVDWADSFCFVFISMHLWFNDHFKSPIHFVLLLTKSARQLPNNKKSNWKQSHQPICFINAFVQLWYNWNVLSILHFRYVGPSLFVAIIV